MKFSHWLPLGAALACAASLGLGGCHNSTSGVHPGDGGGGTSVSGSAGAGGTSGGGTGGAYDGPTFGQDGAQIGHTQCSDGIDNDHDGFTDYNDPECIGPLDDDEGTFATGIPGDNMDPCKQDCFFDGNSGMGDDGCQWQLKCDPPTPEAALGCPYDWSFHNCPTTQAARCLTGCRALPPNGCDCFG